MEKAAPYHTENKRNSAFTLVELAVVLVIIALVFAVVLSAKSLLRQARVQGIVSDAERYHAIINEFDAKYHALPGDMIDFDSFFAAATNGNGDRKITASASEERLNAWHHLSLDGFVKEAYSAANLGDNFIAGENTPATPLEGIGFSLDYDTIHNAIGNFLQIGADNTGVGNNLLNGSAFTSNEAEAVDRKIDDAVADSGNVFAAGGMTGAIAGNGCVDGTDQYIKSNNNTVACRLIFWLETPR